MNFYSSHVSPAYTCQTNTALHVKPGDGMRDNACIWTAAALCNVTVHVHYSVLLDLHIRPTNTVQFTMTV
jgi:hypothetical protein